jgi:hypothetical protein
VIPHNSKSVFKDTIYSFPVEKEFIKDIDYYLEDGFVIFTESYLKEKGECCGNNCRHCPYEKPVIKGNHMIADDNKE